jgi:tetratricopeptide (TPR) repeat protein
LNPEYANAYYNRGIAYNDLKQYNEAIADYTKAIELNPKFARHITTGELFLKK